MLALFTTQKANAFTTIQATLAQEKYPLFTVNDYYLVTTREKWLSRYKEARREKRVHAVHCRPVLPGTDYALADSVKCLYKYSLV